MENNNVIMKGELSSLVAPGSRVQITLETVNVKVESTGKIISLRRPMVVEGPVVPTETKGRGGAPIPIALADIQGTLQTIMPEPEKYRDDTIFKAVLMDNCLGNYPNGGVFECDKGHIFALSNGGPDIGENIIPQLGRGFQQNGDWRKMERNVNTLANELLQRFNLTLFFSVKLEYSSITLGGGALNPNNIINFINMYMIPIQYTYSYFPCVETIEPDNYNLAEYYFALARFMSDSDTTFEKLQDNDFMPLGIFGGIAGINKNLIPLPQGVDAKNFFANGNIDKYTTGINSACGFGFGLGREKKCYINNVEIVCSGT
jgi:hypothetical protein